MVQRGGLAVLLGIGRHLVGSARVLRHDNPNPHPPHFLSLACLTHVTDDTDEARYNSRSGAVASGRDCETNQFADKTAILIDGGPKAHMT